MHKVSLLTAILFTMLLATGCGARKVQGDRPAELDPKDQKIENLTAALSRAQSRIEELDAKVSSLDDKMESQKVTIENLSGNNAIKTQAVGSAAQARAEIAEAGKETISLQIDEAATEFGKAMQLFKSGKYADAELAFNRLTEKFPEHILAGSAQFYAGESYFMMGEYNLATNEYSKVVSTFSSSPRVSTAVVRLAHCYEAAGAPKEADRTMTLARQMFEGNPSLDIPGPERVKKPVAAEKGVAPKHVAEPSPAAVASEAPASAQTKELAPDVMEPPAHTPANVPAIGNAPSTVNDKKLDDLPN